MKDEDKTKNQLIDELVELRQRNVELEKSETLYKRAGEELRESEEKYRMLVESMNEGLGLIDEKGVINYANDKYFELIGRSRNEVIGKHWTKIFRKDTHKIIKNQLVKQKRGVAIPYEIKYIRKDGKEIFLRISPRPIFDANSNLKGSLALFTDITERRKAEDELKASQEESRSLAAYLQSVREEERVKIANEIHDEIAQYLIALKMDLAWMGNKLSKGQKQLVAKNKATIALCDTIIQNVKNLYIGLRPSVLDYLGLKEAIEWRAREFQDKTGIISKAIIDTKYAKYATLDKSCSTAVFCILQEALANVGRHSNATEVKVSLGGKEGDLELKVKDNGKGITEKQFRSLESFGFIGIRERVNYLKGKVKIKGISGKGTTVTVRIPLKTIKQKQSR